ncbi:MAG TPA: sortase [Candidatus Woesebacteria bacterium]|nr:sortase [Candidatus Woesebacteria bacterium]HPJ16790.1 sortase [Candidatus Woesebacteria bacterium]
MAYIYYKKNYSPPKKKPKNKVLATIVFSFGILIFASAVLPIIRFQLEYSIKFGQIVNPLSSANYNRNGSILGEISTDYSQLNNWFTDSKIETPTISTQHTSYTISIPKLKIDQAVVEIGSLDLKNSLIQYPQTALPGQLGNSVVFGHSVLPQFFNPKSYLTIFSTLYRLKPGDEIFVNFDNIQYKYLVEEMFEVQPTDLSILEQRFDNRYFSMVTCSPPGTYLRRLVVKTRIADF